MSTIADDLDFANEQLPFFHPLDSTGPRVWHDYTLMMPVCAVGNVGQLACDLIISTLLHRRECHLAGRVYSPAMMPVVGPNPYGLSGPPASSTEVYVSDKRKLVIIQQRTTYYKNLKGIYIQDLIKWIKESNFSQVLVLSSSFSQCNPDLSQLGKTIPNQQTIHSLVTNQFDCQNSDWKNLNLKPIEDQRKIKVIQDGLPFLPGSGPTKALLKAFDKNSISAAFVIAFCSEGINIPDCYELANLVNDYLKLNCEMNVNGNDPVYEQTLYKSTFLLDDAGDKQAKIQCFWVEPYSWKQF